MALTDVAIQQFRDQFTNEYQQAERKMAGVFQEYRGLIGDAYKIPVVGQLVMQERGVFHTDIPQQVAAYASKIITFTNYVTNMPSDIFEQAEVNASERTNYARTAAWMTARIEDQVGIDALDAAAGTGVVLEGTTNLSVDKIREAGEDLDTNNVPMANRFIAAHANQKKALLSETEATSADYMNVKALVRGDIDTFYGFKFVWFGDMEEGGLPKTGDERTVYAWHRDAMAYGYSINPTVTIDWSPDKQSWLIIPKVRLGAIAVLPKGIVKIGCDETK